MLAADIIQAVGNLTAERFNQGDQVEGRGLIKTISEIQPEEKDVVLKQYQRRVAIEWYEKDTSTFEAKTESIKASMWGMVDTVDTVKGVYYIDTGYGYDSERRLYVLVLEFIIEHIVA